MTALATARPTRTTASRWPSEAASPSELFVVVSAADREASQTPRPAGGASARREATSCRRRGSSAIAVASPTASAIQLPPAEGELDRQREERERRGSGGAGPELAGAGGEAGREQQRGQGREHSERVPVADRLRQPVAGDRVELPHAVGKQPCGEGVGADQADRDRRPGQQLCHGPAANEQHERRQAGEIDERAFELVDRLDPGARPHDRQAEPDEEGGRGGEQRELRARERDLLAEQQGHDRAPGEHERAPAPARREVPTVVGREDAEQERDAEDGRSQPRQPGGERRRLRSDRGHATAS